MNKQKVAALQNRLARLQAQMKDVERQLLKASHPAEPEDGETCEDCGGRGFDCFYNIDPREHGLDEGWVEVQRCDACEKYDDDVDAAYSQFDFVAEVFHGPGRTPGWTVVAKEPLTDEAAEAVAQHKRAVFMDEMQALAKMSPNGGRA